MIHPDTELVHVNDHIGYGVFATKLIPRGAITWVRDDLDQVFTPEQCAGMAPIYRDILNKYTFMDGSGKMILCWDHARFVNHSCDANCLSAGYDFEFAIRDIAAGEELSDDYGYLNLQEPFPCACGSPRCRGSVLADDMERLHAVWDALARETFPFITRVPQPLWPLVREKEEIERAARAPEGPRSIRHHYHRQVMSKSQPSKWREAPRKSVCHPYDDCPAGVTHLGIVGEHERSLLTRALESGRARLSDTWKANCEKREIFWINLWQRSGNLAVVNFEGLAELDKWARGLGDAAYPGQSVICDGYGFITNPVDSKAQQWHVDYTMDYSTIFIPLTRLTPENCLQYAVLPCNAPASARAAVASNLDVVALDSLVDACDYVSVRQLLARPFSIIKMDFGTIHRGVANKSGFERVMFWISFSRSRELLPVEPPVAIIK